jgi:sodium/bile acid cotransporter 7
LKIENLLLLLQRPVGSLVLQAGIIFLPVLWVKIGWALGLVSQALYGPLFFSAILPTTIASCVVFSRNAGGNADYALGHATLSNLLGILLVPFLWFGSFANGGAFGFLFLKIFALVMAPCFVGWALPRIFPVLKEITSKEWYGQVPMLGIAFLVYLSMCDGLYSVETERFLQMLTEVLPSCLAFVLLLHFSGWVFSMRWSKNKEIQVSQFFCLSQKSLAMGLPIASVLFSESQQELFSITLPLFCIHFLQLLIGTLFLKPCKSRIEVGEKAN